MKLSLRWSRREIWSAELWHRDIFLAADGHSLFLLNESFSTTSFEEGFYIAYARDIARKYGETYEQLTESRV